MTSANEDSAAVGLAAEPPRTYFAAFFGGARWVAPP